MKKTHREVKYQLPPLNSLRAFEASARLLSFSKAAEELCVTQGAISKQIKILEDYFGLKLFHRLHQKLNLTDSGKEYQTNVQFMFDFISQKSSSIKSTANLDNTIKVHVFASFGFHWLIPRIQNFKEKYPDLNVDISIGYGSEIRPDALDYDVSIWAYKASTGNIASEKFLDEEMSLVCNPALISKKIRNVSDLMYYPFLINNYRPEVLFDWIKLVGVKKSQIKSTLSFEYLFMLIEAARHGLGLGFVPTFLIQDLLKNGLLINPLGVKYKTKFVYRILYPKDNKNSYKVQSFRKWLFDEILNS